MKKALIYATQFANFCVNHKIEYPYFLSKFINCAEQFVRNEVKIHNDPDLNGKLRKKSKKFMNDLANIAKEMNFTVEVSGGLYPQLKRNNETFFVPYSE